MLSYGSVMVATKQTLILDIQKMMRKESTNTIKQSSKHKGREKERKNGTIKQPENN